MRFTKMQGLGNDYLYVFGEVPPDAAELSVRLSDRHFGVGSDGMIFIGPSATADFSMRIFNADGSEAKMCGNGIRCVGKYVYERGHTAKTDLSVETLSGIKRLKLDVADGKVRSVSVSMGSAEAGGDARLEIAGREIVCTPVSVGNPHAVIFVDDIEGTPVTELGPVIEHDAFFPGGVNVEFVRFMAPQKLRMRVWERGSGVTLACGTGACASAAAAVKKGLCRSGSPITVLLDGGPLEIVVDGEYNVTMNGPAGFVCEGETLL
ncbi:MAG: diaminopimelate epimerase [Mailhella sp.]|nr:diaminopimelate epimerase [Mailhella sp.]